MKIKVGVDRCGGEVDLGERVVLNKVGEFEEKGDMVEVVMGDLRGKMGDGRGKSGGRKQVRDEEVGRNGET